MAPVAEATPPPPEIAHGVAVGAAPLCSSGAVEFDTGLQAFESGSVTAER